MPMREPSKRSLLRWTLSLSEAAVGSCAAALLAVVPSTTTGAARVL